MSGFRCLALEAGVATASVAACNGGERCETLLPNDGKAAAALFQAIDETLAMVSLGLEDLDCIAFGRGPGSFTGLRVAAAAAQGLGLGMNRKLCAVSSLAALAQDAVDHGGGEQRLGDEPADRGDGRGGALREAWVAPCLSAGRAGAFMGWYRVGEDGLVSSAGPDRLASGEDCRAPGNERFVAAGELWAQSSALRSAHGGRILRVVEEALPRARSVLRLARREHSQGRLVSPKDAQPVYLRSVV